MREEIDDVHSAMETYEIGLDPKTVEGGYACPVCWHMSIGEKLPPTTGTPAKRTFKLFKSEKDFQEHVNQPGSEHQKICELISCVRKYRTLVAYTTGGKIATDHSSENVAVLLSEVRDKFPQQNVFAWGLEDEQVAQFFLQDVERRLKFPNDFVRLSNDAKVYKMSPQAANSNVMNDLTYLSARLAMRRKGKVFPLESLNKHRQNCSFFTNFEWDNKSHANKTGVLDVQVPHFDSEKNFGENFGFHTLLYVGKGQQLPKIVDIDKILTDTAVKDPKRVLYQKISRILREEDCVQMKRIISAEKIAFYVSQGKRLPLVEWFPQDTSEELMFLVFPGTLLHYGSGSTASQLKKTYYQFYTEEPIKDKQHPLPNILNTFMDTQIVREFMKLYNVTDENALKYFSI